MQQIYCSRSCYGLDRRGDRHHRFKGGNISPLGYRRFSMCGELVHEHRLVMEKIVGRQLSSREIVHHKDENKLNNSPENLELLANQTEHMKAHCKRYRSATHKECSKCGVIKLRADFYRNNAPGRDPNYPMCKACMKATYPHSVSAKKSE